MWIYIGHNIVSLRLDVYCDGATSEEYSYPFVVTGHSGVGKSAALANQVFKKFSHVTGTISPNSFHKMNCADSFCFSHIEDELHLNFANSRCGYIGQNVVSLRLDAYCDRATNEEYNYPFVVTGHSGVGKSAALAHWTTQRKANVHPTRGLGCYGEFIFWHAIGCSRLSTTLSYLLKRLVTSLTKHFELKEVIDLAEEKLAWILPRLLERASKKGKVIIVIDGGFQNMCSRDNDGYGLKWLPMRLPQNVRMILSVTIPCSSPPFMSEHASNLQNKIRRVWNEIQRRQYSTMEMEKFDNNVMTAVADKFLLPTANFDPLINRSQLCDKLLTLECARNAFFLTTLLQGLLHVRSCLGYGPDDVAKCLAMWTSSEVRSSFDLLDHMLMIFELGIDKIDNVSPHVLDTNETRHGALIGHALSLLFVARHGLHENELLDLLARVREDFRWTNQTEGTLIPVKLKILNFITQEKRRLIDIFRALDTDRNGAISHEEFFMGMRKLGLMGVTHDEVALLINEVDTNGDGEIDFVETMDYFEDICRNYIHGARRGSVFVNAGTSEMIAKNKWSSSNECMQTLISTLQVVGVVCIEIKEQGRILVLPFENVLRDVVWKKYIRTKTGEAKNRAFFTEYFLVKEPSLRMCEELPWHLKKSNDLIALKKVLGDLRILDAMYNRKELKPDLFIYLLRLSSTGKFDMVIEYNRAIEHWYKKNNPSSSQVSSMVAFLADVMLWYSKNTSSLIKVPPFMRIEQDDVQLHKLGIEWVTVRSITNTNKVEKQEIRSDTYYFFNRWIWIQYPWLALSNASKAIATHDQESNTKEGSTFSLPKDIGSNGLSSYENCSMPTRQQSMVNVDAVMEKHRRVIMAKANRCSSNCEIQRHSTNHFERESDTGEKEDLRNSYIELRQVKKVYDHDVVEGAVREKYLKEIKIALSENILRYNQNHRRLAAGEAVIEKLMLRLDQIKRMIEQAARIESVHEQILVVLLSCQPRFQTTQLQLEQQIALSKQQISDLCQRQEEIDGEIGKIKTSSKKVSTEIQVALHEKNYLQPRLERLHRKARERKKSERTASFDPELFSRRMKREGIVAKRRITSNHRNGTQLVVHEEESSSLHPMQKIAYAAGSFDPQYVAKKMQMSESLTNDLSLDQEKSELNRKMQHDILNNLQRKIKEYHLSDRMASKLAAGVDEQDVKDFELLVQIRQSNLQQLTALLKHVLLAVHHLVELTVDFGDSDINQLNSFIIAMDASKSCLWEDLTKVARAIEIIHNTALEHGELREIKARKGYDVIDAGSYEQLSSGENDNVSSRKMRDQNTRVLSKSERESLYVEVTTKLHGVEDERCGIEDESERAGSDSEIYFEKLDLYVRQARTNASGNEQQRANTLCRANQNRKGLISEAGLQRKNP